MESLFPMYYNDKIYDISEHIISLIENIADNGNSKITIPLWIYLSVIYKALCWNYENEWRIVISDQKQLVNNMFIRTPKPTKLYLGTNISDFRKNQLIEIANKQDCEVFQMFPKGDEYSLIALPI